jgi:hypothetical protein
MKGSRAMAYRNDSSSDHSHWSNRKLIDEIRRISNLASFGVGFLSGDKTYTFRPGWANQTGSDSIDDFVRDQTRIYRDSWLNPLIDELERRTVKPKKATAPVDPVVRCSGCGCTVFASSDNTTGRCSSCENKSS